MKKALIIDSGILINFAMNGILYVIEELKKEFEGHFIITESVKYEVVDRPMKVQRFEFEAVKIQALLDNKTLVMPKDLGIDLKKLSSKTKEFTDKANHFVRIDERWVNLVSEAEMSCLALSEMLMEQGYETIIAIDERTTRILGENPEQIEDLMSNKLHKKVTLDTKEINLFNKNRFIRSPELVYVAFKKGLFHNIKGSKALEAALYATKFKGSAISFEEINELKKL